MGMAWGQAGAVIAGGEVGGFICAVSVVTACIVKIRISWHPIDYAHGSDQRREGIAMECHLPTSPGTQSGSHPGSENEATDIVPTLESCHTSVFALDSEGERKDWWGAGCSHWFTISPVSSVIIMSAWSGGEP